MKVFLTAMSKLYTKQVYLMTALLLPLGAWAQQTPPRAGDSSGAKQLNEIVVTADKANTKLSETGKSVIVITKEQLQKSGGKTLSQVLNEQAGIIINGANSNPGATKAIYIDGAGSGYTLVMLDGVPLQDASNTDNTIDLRTITLESIERIEIVKGSQSVLYGSDAIAGVINIITKKGGGGKPFAVGANESYGTYNTEQAGAFIGGTLQKFSYNAGYAYYHTDGISEATDTVPHTTAPKDGYTQNSFHANLTWDPSRGISITPFVLYSHYSGREDAGSFDIDPNYTYTLSSLQTGVHSLWNIGRGQLHVVYSYSHTDRTDLDDSVPSLAVKGNFLSDNLAGYEHYADAYLSYPIGKLVNIVGGADYKNLATAQTTLDLYPDYYNPQAVDTSASALGKDSARYHQVGIYGAATGKLPGGLYADGGLRYNTNSKYGNTLVFNFDPNYTIARTWKVFVNLASGYKTPSLYQLYSPYGNKDLLPEKAMSYEGGLQYTAPSGAFRIRGAYFLRDIDNVIVFYTNPVTFAEQYMNQNKEIDHGFKVEAEWKPIPGLSIAPNYMYVTGKTTTQTVYTHMDSTYSGLLRVPKNSVGVTVGYQVTKKLYISSNLQWQDQRMDVYYNNNTGADAPVYMHGFALWNAYAEYQLWHRHLKVFVDTHNITDTKYMEVYGYNTQGFTIAGGVRLTL